MPEIGDQLRETRMRNRIDISEVEASTKIRAKYLRALENEEWDLLPGPTFVKTFLRTYADYLGLDARNLVEEYRARYERPSAQELAPFGTNIGARRARPRRPILAPWMAVVAGVIVLVAALYLLGTWGSDDDPGDEASATPTPGATAQPAGEDEGERKKRKRTPAKRTVVRLQIQPTGPVSVCVEDAAGEPVIENITLRGERGHRDVPLQAVQDVLRHGRGRDARRRQGLPGVRRRADRIRGPGGREAARRCRRPSAPPADDGPRGHRRHGHRGAVGDRDRPQRAVALGAAARARRRARAPHGRGRPAARRARGARLPGGRARRADPDLRRARPDRGRPDRGGRRRVRGPADGARRGAGGADPRHPAPQPRRASRR